MSSLCRCPARLEFREVLAQQGRPACDGATVILPLAPAQWAPLYGMLKDRFGVTWVINVSAAPAAAS